MKLSTTERRELAPLLQATLERVGESPFAARLATLREGFEADELQPEQEETLALFIETLAQSRRLAAEGAGLERRLGYLYRRTERGKQATGGVADASGLLEGLAGQRLTAAGLSLVAPGTYILHLETDGLEVRLELGPRGVGASAAVGGL
jgi:hypothetical protein